MLPEPFSDFEVYANVAAAEAGVSGAGAPIRAIRCSAAGNLVVKKGGGVTVALPFLAGETQHVNISGVVAAGSGAVGPIVVYR